MTILIALAALQSAAAATPVPASEAPGDATVVVTATRSGDPVRADLIGGSVTVLDAAAIEQRQTRIVSDILRDVPGVAVSRSGGVGGVTQIRVRGTEANHVLVLIDGIEVADPFQGEYDFASLLADETARIEVLRGQQSSLYGSDAIGGVIHYITPSGTEAPGFRVRAEGGSFGTVGGAARAAGVAGGLDYALSATAYTTDGTPTARGGDRDVGSDAYAASAKLGLDAGPVRLTAVGRYSLTRSQFNDTSFFGPSFGLVVDSPGVRSRTEAAYGLLRAAVGQAEDRFTGALSAQIADTDRSSYSSFGRDSGDKGRRYKGSGEATLRFGEGRVRHRLTAAVDVEREEYRNTSPASPFVFTGRRHADNVGIVGQYDVTVDDALALGGSVRRDENDRFDDATTWRAQASYRFAGGTRLRAAAGSGIKNPLFYELYGFSDGRYIGNPDLKPERSIGWEAGAEQAIDGVGTLGVTYFRNRLKDEIFTTYPAPTFTATPANRTTTSRQQGVEAFANLKFGGGFRLDLAYTYLRARESGLEEVRRPKHSGSANLSWTGLTDERLTLTGTVRVNGRQTDLAFTDPSFVPVRVRLGSFVLANLAGEYRLNDTLSLFGRVENLLGEDYEEVFSYATPGRAAYAGVRARF